MIGPLLGILRKGSGVLSASVEGEREAEVFTQGFNCGAHGSLQL